MTGCYKSTALKSSENTVKRNRNNQLSLFPEKRFLLSTIENLKSGIRVELIIFSIATIGFSGYLLLTKIEFDDNSKYYLLGSLILVWAVFLTVIVRKIGLWFSVNNRIKDINNGIFDVWIYRSNDKQIVISDNWIFSNIEDEPIESLTGIEFNLTHLASLVDACVSGGLKWLSVRPKFHYSKRTLPGFLRGSKTLPIMIICINEPSFLDMLILQFNNATKRIELTSKIRNTSSQSEFIHKQLKALQYKSRWRSDIKVDITDSNKVLSDADIESIEKSKTPKEQIGVSETIIMHVIKSIKKDLGIK